MSDFYEPETIKDTPYPGIGNGGTPNSSGLSESEQYGVQPATIEDVSIPKPVIADALVAPSFDTEQLMILGSYHFGQVGAIQIGLYQAGISGDIKISPNGIVGRNSSGVTTFAIDGTTGNATFAGTIAAGVVVASNALVVGTNVGLGTAQDSAGVTTIVGNTVTTGYINALNVTANSVNANWVYAGHINANQITAGTIDAGTINVTNLNASNITQGGFSANRISGGGIDSGQAISKLFIGYSGGNGLNISQGNSQSSYGQPFGCYGTVITTNGSLNMNADIGLNGHNINGNSSTNMYAGHFNVVSDRRLKKFIKPFQDSLPKLLKLRPVTFQFKNEKHGVNHIGLIAQEVEKRFPTIVTKDQKGMRTITYDELIPVLISAIQDQQRQIDRLSKKVV